MEGSTAVATGATAGATAAAGGAATGGVPETGAAGAAAGATGSTGLDPEQPTTTPIVATHSRVIQRRSDMGREVRKDGSGMVSEDSSNSLLGESLPNPLAVAVFKTW
ncbi:MAG: hypothetical protein DWH91_12900 [Planctomycetota bacterium]|nr:MAG: hypothetical protein DWH91_12900 [Planctomycetota bacterium]